MGLENWSQFNLHPGKEEGRDYVIVGSSIWNMLKKTYGGGPEIQLFLISNEKIIEDEGLYNQKNFLYQNAYSMYGYPDKNPEMVDVTLEINDSNSIPINVIKIPYRLLLSKYMTPKSLLYH